MIRLFSRTFFLTTICALLLVFTAADAHAQKKLALLIGNGNYQYINGLKNPRNDVELLASKLRQLGFEVLIRKNTDSKGMRRAISHFASKLREYGKRSIGFFFYAGHGLQVRGVNYLIPVDAHIKTQADIDIEAFDLQKLINALGTAGRNLNIIVLDACRDNNIPSGTRSMMRGLAHVEAPSGSLIAFSTQAGNTAADGDGENSPFTEALAAQITIPGLKIQSVFDKVRERVYYATHMKQWPSVNQSIIGNFYPAGKTPVADNGSQRPAEPIASTGGNTLLDRAARAWQHTKDTKDPRILQLFADRYKGTTYADRATLKSSDLLAKPIKTAAVSPKLLAQERQALSVAEKDVHGRFFVFFHSLGQQNDPDGIAARRGMEETRADLMEKTDQNAFDLHIIDTNQYPRLTKNLWSVVQGPYTRDYALFKLNQVKSFSPTSYIKAGR